ncbi:tRNA (adenosine(37)-N6)-threonylcarbamoyltransferase complex dimerization subunit type 1 TsaB [Actinokineospora globicatena]|uniref:tRNA (adenosine(37)-N6)-threonylcarbamoyltransferase complex dimerization subunit type 1 TsaB n=1 Tax=Actinokineospora globicatena TaxID=103729 RepID=UPI0020A2EACA|nr:tRNA (adenosine(37)-N6)-threonylcarbamoyltransferase complex dimerization subunit type 1 TsaB [Actinokineospora globicatena]MCP2301899.1 tRNA threonylcarbamoyl adenosine modification protein YeaZ [Actinokineospora globicatena]GLW76442.1 tRNA (adenosine(37)-N6)-threonylcarbamoyltransferase complex dimerization subunit type 1 TsaB [Actinokineospora globicatena]GLW83277.1 tRNA (adenosine(37)-N6)-threonylcarbamoyltransferase complex dimerization subunit type 1 TsaB [Actinokineospora globicatena]
MLVLAVDTATPAVTAGVVELTGGTPRLLALRVTVDARAHGELLTPHLRDAVAEAGHTLAELDAIVCGIGPGPFTGLRAGMVTAAALGHALDRPVFPVCSLDAIAAEVTGEPLLVVTDARRKELYWATYAADGTRTTEPSVDKPADIPLTGITRIAGTRIADLGPPVTGPEHPSPVGLVRAADLTGEPGPLTPLYLRRPDAVEPGARKRVSPG